jgi:hypothetical protein
MPFPVPAPPLQAASASPSAAQAKTLLEDALKCIHIFT